MHAYKKEKKVSNIFLQDSKYILHLLTNLHKDTILFLQWNLLMLCTYRPYKSQMLYLKY